MRCGITRSRRSWFACGLFLLALLAATLAAQKPQPTVPASAALIREEQSGIDGHASETWRLVWTAPPRSVCGPDGPFFYTCPCVGFAFGEGGDMNLIRMKGSREIERLALNFDVNGDAPPFDDGPDTPHFALQRWAREPGDKESDDLSAFIRNRSVTHVMYFGDYDHDGLRSEFFLETGTAPCGRPVGVVVGVSKRNPKLHAIGTLLHPNQPLIADRRAWDALLVNPGPVRVTTWTCGDHGADKETELELEATPLGIKATRREYECTSGARGALARTEEF